MLFYPFLVSLTPLTGLGVTPFVHMIRRVSLTHTSFFCISLLVPQWKWQQTETNSNILLAKPVVYTKNWGIGSPKAKAIKISLLCFSILVVASHQRQGLIWNGGNKDYRERNKYTYINTPCIISTWVFCIPSTQPRIWPRGNVQKVSEWTDAWMNGPYFWVRQSLCSISLWLQCNELSDISIG